ncbi:MAG: DUF2062 domain-containing protein [Sphingomonadales bacterium]|nr:DUF2062 domain-containing protein [Sphingomonadales bacterium]
MRKWFKRMAPDQDRLMASRWLRPVAPRLAHPGIWHFNRRSVARGVALGLFAAFLLPVGQILFAAVIAAAARSNLLVAATMTWVSNPFTFGPIYFAAWKAGGVLLGAAGFGHLSGVSLPLGLAALALAGAAIGYLAVQLGWRIALGLQWSRRRRVRAG